MVSKVILVTAIIVCILAVATIGVSIWKLVKSKKKGKKKFILNIGISILLIAVIVANFAIYQFNNVIDIYFDKTNMNTADIVKAKASAKDLTEDVEGEGIVLLKNNNSSLPIDTKNINVFGYSSLAVSYGGSGSGAGNESDNVDLYKGLKNAGYQTNSDLKEFYEKRLKEKTGTDIFHLTGGDYNIYEPSVDDYSNDLIQKAQSFSDTALVMFSRSSGEGADLPTDMDGKVGGTKGKSYLELSDNEQAMLKMVEKNFKQVIVLINSGSPMELGFLDDDAISAALWVGNPGSTGCTAIGEVLNGTINPSGRLADTYPYSAKSNPAYYNSGNFQYENTKSKVQTQWFKLDHYLYLDYQEGIYVGYRYYETRWIDNTTGACDEEAYHAAVQYPFGYGLSYTDFSQKITGFQNDGTTISMDVTVTNTGSVAGKDVVELYDTPPYTSGGIEKSNVVLVDYDKTDIIQPGDSKVVHFSVPVEDLASYDYKGIKAKNGGYVLEAGSYQLKIMANAHDVLDSRSFSIDQDIIYDKEHNGARSTDKTVATNLFDDVSNGNNISYVSRADWEGTDITSVPKSKDASKEIVNAIENPNLGIDENAKAIKFAKSGLTIEDMKGLDYDDPKWEKLLEQLSIKDMVNLTGLGGFATQEIDSVGKYKTTDTDGPAGINGLVNGASGVQYTSAVTLASTWNPKLAEKFGNSMATEARLYGVSGIYAPAMNIHRTGFGGRNFEYYSEDGVLAGKIASHVVSGINDKGIYCYIKHFALDNQETNRENVCVWSNEQAMREVYFKAFEMSVKEGKAKAVMDADCRIGTNWCGGSSALNNDLLRSEWGFQGMVITDYIGDNFKDADVALYSGCDLMLSSLGELATNKVTGNNAGQQALRTASHNILYTIANSDAQEISAKGLSLWVYVLIGIDLILLGLFIFASAMLNRAGKNIEIKEY